MSNYGQVETRQKSMQIARRSRTERDIVVGVDVVAVAARLGRRRDDDVGGGGGGAGGGLRNGDSGNSWSVEWFVWLLQLFDGRGRRRLCLLLRFGVGGRFRRLAGGFHAVVDAQHRIERAVSLSCCRDGRKI